MDMGELSGMEKKHIKDTFARIRELIQNVSALIKIIDHIIILEPKIILPKN